MSLVLRLQKDSALTNEELDNNFIYLDERITTNQANIATVVETTIPELIVDTTSLLAGKQPLNAKLTSLSAVATSGFAAISGSNITSRTIEGGVNILVTNGDGIAGNPTITLATNVLTADGTQIITNKNINGNSNTISNVSLIQSVKDILPLASGGTNASTVEQARSNLNVVIKPASNGIVVKTGTDASASRSIQVTGTGTSVVNADGVAGNPTVVINSTAVNTPSTVVARDASGNFAAGTITANLNGSASSAIVAQTASKADTLTSPRTINGVSFDGSQNITVADSTKLPLSGGVMGGRIEMAFAPTIGSHVVNKSYVDENLLSVTYGSLILSSDTTPSGDITPPAGRTMASLKGFLPAMGSSLSATPTHSTNLMIAIDISGSAGSDALYNGVQYANAYDAAVIAAKFIINQYSAIGPCNVCLIRQSNSSTGVYKWTSPAQALIDLNSVTSFAGTTGTVIQAYTGKPSTTAQSIFYFFSDSNHGISAGSAFGGSEATWKTFLNTNKMPAYAVCVDNAGNPTNINQISWDGRSGTDMNGFRALADADIPTANSPGLYNTGSIAWSALSDRIRVSLTEGSDVSNISVNWLALWG